MNDNKLVEELKALTEKYKHNGGHNGMVWIIDIEKILSYHEAEAIEPFEKLAFRKGILYIKIWPFKDGKFEIDLEDYNGILKGYVGDTYTETKQKVRAFLETLPDNVTKEKK